MSGIAVLKKSQNIRSRAASRFFKGARHARDHGRPLNLHVTLNLSHTSYPGMLASAAVSDICGKFTRWLAYQSEKAIKRGEGGYGRPTYEAVIEAPGGIYHVHWLVHVPDDLQELFEKTLPKWFSRVCGPVVKPTGAIHIGPIDTVMALSRYCMKGVDPSHARRCFVRPINQGVVFGKRVAISRSLGPRAREQEADALRAATRATGSGSHSGSAAGHGPWHAAHP